MLERLSKNTKITLSILFTFLGLYLTLYTYLDSIKNNLFNEKNIAYLETIVENIEEIEEIIEELPVIETIQPTTTLTTSSTQVTTTISYDYIGFLEIPTIKLKRGFVSLTSKYNKLSFNILLVKGSTMPDEINGNLILAAHRGNSSVSFFDKLYKLSKGDKAYINYNGQKYTYKLVNAYEEPKDGNLTIRRDANKNVLTLITCTRNNKETQTIFIFEMQR